MINVSFIEAFGLKARLMIFVSLKGRAMGLTPGSLILRSLGLGLTYAVKPYVIFIMKIIP